MLAAFPINLKSAQRVSKPQKAILPPQSPHKRAPPSCIEGTQPYGANLDFVDMKIAFPNVKRSPDV